MSSSTYVVTRTHILTTSCVVVSVWEPGQLSLDNYEQGRYSTTTTFTEHPEICAIHPKWWGKVDTWFVEADFPVSQYPVCSDERIKAVGAYHEALYALTRCVAAHTIPNHQIGEVRTWMGEYEFSFGSVEEARQFADEARRTIVEHEDVHQLVKQALEASNG